MNDNALIKEKQKIEMHEWLNEWRIGTKGIFGGWVKDEVEVINVEWYRGYPILHLKATTGAVYYCKYGGRKYLLHI